MKRPRIEKRPRQRGSADVSASLPVLTVTGFDTTQALTPMATRVSLRFGRVDLGGSVELASRRFDSRIRGDRASQANPGAGARPAARVRLGNAGHSAPVVWRGAVSGLPDGRRRLRPEAADPHDGSGRRSDDRQF